MELINKQTITVDFYKSHMIPTYTFYQHDNNQIEFVIEENGNPADLSTVSRVLLNIQRPDKKVVSRELDKAGNKILYQMQHEEMKASGQAIITLQFYNEAAERLSTAKIKIYIASTVEANVEFKDKQGTLYQQIIMEMDGLKDQLFTLNRLTKDQADYAKEQGDAAKTAAELAIEETENLDEMKTATVEATGAANTAAEAATTAAETAETNAEYAKAQGDYAKEQIGIVEQRTEELNGVDAVQFKDRQDQFSAQLADIITLKPNGIDDTEALQACNGKSVKLSAGTFLCRGGIQWNAGTHIFGSGIGKTTIKLMENSDNTMIEMVNASYSSLRDVKLDGNWLKNKVSPSDPDSAVLKVRTTSSSNDSSYGSQYQNIYAVDGANHLIYLMGKKQDGTSNWNWVMHFDHIYCRNCRGYSFYDETTDNVFSNMYINNGAKASLYINFAASNMYSNIKVDGEGGYINSGLESEIDGAGVIIKNSKNVRFVNFDVQSAKYVGVKVFKSGHLHFNGDINNCGTYYQDKTIPQRGVGIYIKDSSKITGDLSFYNASGTEYQNRDVIINPGSSRIFISSEDSKTIGIENASKTSCVQSMSDFSLAWANTVNKKVTLNDSIQNLLKNAGLEEGEKDWNLSIYNSTLDTSSKIKGSNSVLMVNDGTKTISALQNVDGLIPGHIYAVSAKVLISSFTSGTAPYINCATLDGKTGVNLEVATRVDTTKIGEIQTMCAFIEIPINTTGIQYRFFSHMNVSEIYFDDFALFDLTSIFGEGSEPTVEKVQSILKENEWENGILNFEREFYLQDYHLVLEYLLNKVNSD